MKSTFFTALTFVGLQGAMAIEFSNTHGLGVTPASHEMCAVDGLAQTLLEGGPTKAKAARGPPPRAIKKGGEGHDEDEGESDSEGEGEHHAQVASQGGPQGIFSMTDIQREDALVKAEGTLKDATTKFKDVTTKFKDDTTEYKAAEKAMKDARTVVDVLWKIKAARAAATNGKRRNALAAHKVSVPMR